ncbi:hypothetical protein DFH07DRAFT_184618 [Mycena maculata]|uniref:Uncharacterized protein n=1 Tax=Mycena maculata TaxID=230809 RepID=A0AAD7MSY2_9AGAR|nr:hypothetical protein DFH07DRAFT_184618 [Mycena maculata]
MDFVSASQLFFPQVAEAYMADEFHTPDLQAILNLYVDNLALKDARAGIVLTATTYPECSYTPYQGNDFTRKYHWPNGVSPSPSSLLLDFERYIPGRFCVESVEDMGAHYPRCLREWGRRFGENWTEELSAKIIARYPELKRPENMAMFRRKWAYMFSYMEVAYSRWWIGLTCWTLKRPGREAAICS